MVKTKRKLYGPTIPLRCLCFDRISGPLPIRNTFKIPNQIAAEGLQCPGFALSQSLSCTKSKQQLNGEGGKERKRRTFFLVWLTGAKVIVSCFYPTMQPGSSYPARLSLSWAGTPLRGKDTQLLMTSKQMRKEQKRRRRLLRASFLFLMSENSGEEEDSLKKRKPRQLRMRSLSPF